MSELYHYGVRGMKWGVRKLDDSTSSRGSPMRGSLKREGQNMRGSLKQEGQNKSIKAKSSVGLGTKAVAAGIGTLAVWRAANSLSKGRLSDKLITNPLRTKRKEATSWIRRYGKQMIKQGIGAAGKATVLIPKKAFDLSINIAKDSYSALFSERGANAIKKMFTWPAPIYNASKRLINKRWR